MRIGKSTWKIYNFGDIALNLKVTVKDPLSEGFERYVGLEHIIPGNIHIKSWGKISDGTTFTRVFCKGHVLFGKRRAYQKKAAIAEFDGVCSGDILVFEANEEYLISDLLPFITQSDKFFDYAVKTSAGSLSPRTKYKDLAKLKFKLPPLDEQKRLAGLLWSVDEVIEGWIEVLNQTEILIRALLKKKLKSYQVNEVKVKEILEENNKFKVSKVPQTEYLTEGEYPIVNQSKTLIAGYSNNKELLYVGELPVLVFGDHTTEIKYVDFSFILGADGTKVLFPTPNIRARYLFYAICDLNLKPVGYRRHFSILKDKKIKVPNLDKQDKCIKELDYLFNKKMLQKHNILNLKNIQKQIINQIFGGKS